MIIYHLVEPGFPHRHHDFHICVFSHFVQFLIHIDM